MCPCLKEMHDPSFADEPRVDESVNNLYVFANESYEEFAWSRQTEYEEDCGVTFWKVPITALANLSVSCMAQSQVPGLRFEIDEEVAAASRIV